MAKRLTSKRIRGKARPQSKSHIKPQITSIKKGRRQPQPQRVQKRKSIKSSPRRQQPKQKIAKYKAIKSTSDIKIAVVNKKESFAQRFLEKSVAFSIKRKKGWNLKEKNYRLGGSALIYAYISDGTEFAVDESAMQKGGYKLYHKKVKGEGFIRKKDAWYEAFFTKTIHKDLGRMTFEEAKREYEKHIGKERKIFVDMASQFSADNKERGRLDEVRWFKLRVG